MIRLLLRTYRRVTPLWVRRFVAGRPHLRNGVENAFYLVTSVRDRIRVGSAGLGLRATGRLSRADHVVVMVGDRPRVAFSAPGLTPLEARNRTLEAVSSALEAAGVEYFTVRGYSNNRSTIGVPARRRSAAELALRGLATSVPAYIGRVGPNHRLRPAHTRRSWRRMSGARIVRFVRFDAVATEGLVHGTETACDVEFWESTGTGSLQAPRPNRVTETVPEIAPRVSVPGRTFTRLASAATEPPPPTVRTRAEFAVTLPEDVDFPIDVVYTWVDGDDPDWQRRRAAARGGPYHPEAANDARYLSRDELRYSLRSLAMYAPWVRHVYLVTDGQTPAWLDPTHPGITVVDHTAIFDDIGLLPTFNSHSIESQLHHIKGLSEHFLYFNDDMFLGAPMTPGNFFLSNGITKFFTSRALLPPGPPGPHDVPVSVAGKNNRGLLQRRFGTVVTQKMKHVPYPLRRSVLEEIETAYPEQHRTTAASRFRSTTDISIPSALYHHYAFHTGRAIPGSVRYGYFDLAHPTVPRRLRRLLAKRNLQAFCLNDTQSTAADIESQTAVIQPFMRAYFPIPSPYELTSPQEDRCP